MNKRIKELLKQSTTTYLSGMGERDEVDQEKFAELIVRECAELVEYNSKGAGRDIKEHFGVEE